jgi:hypothetical protein
MSSYKPYGRIEVFKKLHNYQSVPELEKIKEHKPKNVKISNITFTGATKTKDLHSEIISQRSSSRPDKTYDNYNEAYTSLGPKQRKVVHTSVAPITVTLPSDRNRTFRRSVNKSFLNFFLKYFIG